MSGGSKYFSTTKKGEIRELQDDLNSNDRLKIKEAVKKVIAAMTVGKDVSMLFSDVIKSMGTDNIELKKLVYLYIINYARSQPEKAILVVNMFQKDATNHPNPLVRALAIRTMGCIRVDRITEYLCDPLNIALKDKDPYVRKTAAICVAKLYDIQSDLVEERGFIEVLRDMLNDVNPMVVANAVAALTEISEASGIDYFKINGNLLSKLLTALNECLEWGRIYILDALSKIREINESQGKDICDRVIAQIQHNNSAVVMAAVKVVINVLPVLQRKDDIDKYCKKLAQPLVTLVSSNRPEVQYVALRNIGLIVNKYPRILHNEIRVFFIKFNDAPYVKMEKLSILIQLATKRNVEQVLLELREYTQEINIAFVRKAVHSVGRIAIRMDAAAEKCIKVLNDLIKTKVSYVVQEAVLVIQDILRRYPGRYERIIQTLCENIETIDEPESKSAMIWLLGEYAQKVPDSDKYLKVYIDTFNEESNHVQLQILTATVKLFLKRPDKAKELVQTVLTNATEKSDNPDLRDRGYMYWRLLSSSPAAAKQVVLSDKPRVGNEVHAMDTGFLKELLGNLSSLSSVYHENPKNFVKNYREINFKPNEDDDESDGSDGSNSDSVSSGESSRRRRRRKRREKERRRKKESKGNAGDGDRDRDRDRRRTRDSKKSSSSRRKRSKSASDSDDSPRDRPSQRSSRSKKTSPAKDDSPGITEISAPSSSANNQNGSGPVDLLGGLFDAPAPSKSSSSTTNTGGNGSGASTGSLLDDFGFGDDPTPASASSPDKSMKLVLSSSAGSGLKLSVAFDRKSHIPTCIVCATNEGNKPIARIDVKFNRNYLGIVPQSSLPLSGNLNPSSSQTVDLPMSLSGEMVQKKPLNTNVQVAVRISFTSGDKSVAKFEMPINPSVFFTEDVQRSQTEFLSNWKGISSEMAQTAQMHVSVKKDQAKSICERNWLHFIAPREIPGKGVSLYFSGKIKGVDMLFEVSLANSGACRIVVKSANRYLSFVGAQMLIPLLSR